MSPLVLIGLGSNLGDRRGMLEGAIATLRETPRVLVEKVSAFHETRPVGGPPGQGMFLNAAAVLVTNLDPLQFLHLLQEIEARFGRDRTVRWGERTLDLDLLLFGDEIIDTPELTVPHPQFSLRRFVLAPAAEVAPRAVEPWTERTVADLLANLDHKPSYLALDRPDLDIRGPVPAELSIVFQGVVESLGATRLRRDQLLPRRRFLSDPLSIQYAKIRTLGRAMATERWSAAALADRWLVSDFSLEREVLRGVSAVTRRALENHGVYRAPLAMSWLEPTALAAARRALQPTFLVLLGGARRREELTVPQFIPNADDPRVIIEEILAACAATRP
jgi:2-amino-4-hydroxy-6-hydroxymethyldihydropteridine diphosphokinase